MSRRATDRFNPAIDMYSLPAMSTSTLPLGEFLIREHEKLQKKAEKSREVQEERKNKFFAKISQIGFGKVTKENILEVLKELGFLKYRPNKKPDLNASIKSIFGSQTTFDGILSLLSDQGYWKEKVLKTSDPK